MNQRRKREKVIDTEFANRTGNKIDRYLLNNKLKSTINMFLIFPTFYSIKRDINKSIVALD